MLALTLFLGGSVAVIRVASRDFRNEPIYQRITAALGWFSGVAAFCAAIAMATEAVHIGHTEPLPLLNAATWPLVLAVPSGLLAAALHRIGRSKPLSEIGE